MVIFCKRSSVDTVFAEVTVKAPILAAFIKGASYTPYICIYIYIYIYGNKILCGMFYRCDLCSGATYTPANTVLLFTPRIILVLITHFLVQVNGFVL